MTKLSVVRYVPHESFTKDAYDRLTGLVSKYGASAYVRANVGLASIWATIEILDMKFEIEVLVDLISTMKSKNPNVKVTIQVPSRRATPTDTALFVALVSDLTVACTILQAEYESVAVQFMPGQQEVSS